MIHSLGKAEIQYQRKKATFKYDADGLRSKKVFDGVTTEYQYIDGKLYYEGRSDGTKLYFFYDSFGDLTYIYYHKGSVKEKYAVVTNKRGDVVYIFSFDGATKLASYGYDAWGNVVSVTDTSTTGIASINPIRYRGYYYDTDLDLYYLQSRYYNPKIGRFLNADGYFSTGQGVLGHNMFAYCGNNPVNRIDISGNSWDDIKNWFSEQCNKLKKKVKNFFGIYDSVDEAAIASGTNLNNLTQQDNNEHGQGIIHNKKTDTYRLTDVIPGEHSTVDFADTINDENIVAIVHSHPHCNGHIGNEFSNEIIDSFGNRSGDWAVANSNQIDVYLAAPNGNLYVMYWDAGEYNQNFVSDGLPVDNSLFTCQ